MLVDYHGVQSSPLLRLEVVDADGAAVHVGESVGYVCPHCRQADETLHQVWHAERCPLAGEHGRAYYDELEPDVPGQPAPELDPDHEIGIVKSDETRPDIGVTKNEVVAFRCGCGNLDEDLFEVVHDARCELSSDEAGPMTDHHEVPVSPPAE